MMSPSSLSVASEMNQLNARKTFPNQWLPSSAQAAGVPAPPGDYLAAHTESFVLEKTSISSGPAIKAALPSPALNHVPKHHVCMFLIPPGG